MPWDALVPEMIYFLIVSTVLVRWYPVRKRKVEEKPVEVEEEPVEEVPESQDAQESEVE
jgi:hypothetical protein